MGQPSIPDVRLVTCVASRLSVYSAVCIVLLSNRCRAPANNNDVSCGCFTAAATPATASIARCLFVLMPAAPCNFNKSLSTTSTFALRLQRVSRRFRLAASGAGAGGLRCCCCWCLCFSGCWRAAVTKLF